MNEPEPLDPHGLQPAIEAGELQVLRQSDIGTGDVCGTRIQYSKNPDVPRGQGEARVVGTGYHAGQAAYWQARKDEPEILQPNTDLMAAIYGAALEAFVQAQDEGEMNGWDTSEEAAKGRMLKLLFHYFNAGLYRGPEWEVDAVEQKFYMPLGVPGWAAMGTPDLVVSRALSRGRKVVIVDHKTSGRRWQRGKEDPRKNNQAPWYVYWWRQLTGVEADFVFEVITPPDLFEHRRSNPRREHEEAIIAKARLWAGLLSAGVALPPNTTSNLCSKSYCDYWRICPWGEALTASAIREAQVYEPESPGSIAA